jgi:hypothetical protein
MEEREQMEAEIFQWQTKYEQDIEFYQGKLDKYKQYSQQVAMEAEKIKSSLD